MDMNSDIQKISEWMNSYKVDAKSMGYVIGLSGGVDSAVVAALAVNAVGEEKVHGVIMPIESNPADEADAIQFAEELGISYDIIDLTHSYNAQENAYPYSGATRRDDVLMKSNIKARLRMTMLYQFANEMNYLVAGTGNRSEDAVGYFTKYGDGGVDILPIAEYYKFEVRQMALELGIRKEIANRVSTAGLFEGQIDEEDLGITYDKLDSILQFIDGRAEFDASTSEYFGENWHLLLKVLNLINRHKHKGEYPPIFKR